MPVAKYHKMIVMGSATMYRILLVKFSSKNPFPTNPQASEAPLSPRHHFGSLKPVESASTPGFAGLYVFRQEVTSAAITSQPIDVLSLKLRPQ